MKVSHQSRLWSLLLASLASMWLMPGPLSAKPSDLPNIVILYADTKLWKPIKEGNWLCRPGPMTTGWEPYENIPTITEKAASFINRQRGFESPFFLYIALPSPHAPIIPNDAFDGKSQAGPYGDFMVESDHACGQVIQAIDAIGAADNTGIILTAHKRERLSLTLSI